MPRDFADELARLGPDVSNRAPPRAQARAYCKRLATTHYENFTVASLLLPRRLLPHFHAIYAYCRWADDLGDETGGGQRALELLAWWREELLACYRGQARHPVMIALGPTIQRFAIPVEPFLDLLKAFEQDQRLKRYETFAQLLDYCRYSANPVGRLVLYLCACFDERRAALSDQICTGLQLANFWQDVARDFDIGRVYLPAEDRQRFGYTDLDLGGRRCTPAFVDLMRFEVDRARKMFEQGLALVPLMPAEVQIDIDLFIRGGLAILRTIEQVGYNVWQARPTLSKWDKGMLLLGSLVRRGCERGRESFSRHTVEEWKLSTIAAKKTPDPFAAVPRSPTLSRAASYAFCERLARREAGNFYPAFWLLPRRQRLAMCALYAFLRIADDLSDNADSLPTKRQQLHEWRTGLEQCLMGTYSHAIHAALQDTVSHFGIPPDYLYAVLDGVEMDLAPVAFPTFAELRRYCYHVASAVGLACLHIWGCADDRAKEYADQAGVAFQLTNMLRDLGEDAARGRVYLPQDELARFGYDEPRLQQGRRDDAFRALMRFQVQRARQHYDEAWPLARLLPPPGRAVFLMMARTYRALLDEIERRDYDVFTTRIRVSSLRKAWLALRALPARMG